MTKYLGAMGKHQEGQIALPDTSKFPADKVGEGQLLYLLRCTECHNLGNAIGTPLVKQQGPDLIRVARRVDYAWAKNWILNPRKIDPKTRMIVPDLTPEQVDLVRMFVWKTSIEADRTTPIAPSAAAAQAQ